MNGSGPRLAVGVMALAAVMAAACGGDDDTRLITTTSVVVTTAGATTTAPTVETTSPTKAPTTTEAPGGTSSDTTFVPPDPEEISFQVVRQESIRDGIRLFLEIPSGDYTDVDLENLVLSVYEDRDDLFELHVVDNREAVEVLLKAEEERTPEETGLLDRHYLVSLLEGNILRFQGPFANLEGFIIGS